MPFVGGTMIYIIKKCCRRASFTISLVLFSAVISAILCGLNAANEAELRDYDNVFHSIPVRFAVTNLAGTRSEKLSAPGWVADLFTGDRGYSHNFSQFATDIQIRMEQEIADHDDLDKLIGITAKEAAPELLSENRGAINWYEGYDERIFAENDTLCLIPQELSDRAEFPNGEVTLKCEYTYQNGIEVETHEYTLTLKIAGTYMGSETKMVYCPYSVVKSVYTRLGKERVIESISAQLINNDDLDLLKEYAAYWFAQPNATGEETQWGSMGYDSYPYALTIKDELLQQLTESMRSSLIVNNICTILIFVLSMAVGLLIGMLTVRNRKREIMLMRTLGTGNGQVYLEFVLEQMGCILLGILLGGIWFLWRLVWRLAAFAGIYFVGLTLSLLIFMGTSLISTMKEDE